MIVDAQQLNMDLVSADIQSVIRLGYMITTAVSETVCITHPESDDLAFILGTILTDGPDTEDLTKNICVCDDKQVSFLFVVQTVYVILTAKHYTIVPLILFIHSQ